MDTTHFAKKMPHVLDKINTSGHGSTVVRTYLVVPECVGLEIYKH